MNVYLNDAAHQAIENETILEFVRRVESKNAIPTMCQDDRLENFGSCRVCSVEVAREKGGLTKTMASCHTPVFEGAYIYHQTEKIKRLRKNSASRAALQPSQTGLVSFPQNSHTGWLVIT